MVDNIISFAASCVKSVQAYNILLQQHNESLNGLIDSVKKCVNTSTLSFRVDILSAATNKTSVHHESANMTSIEFLSTFVEI